MDTATITTTDVIIVIIIINVLFNIHLSMLVCNYNLYAQKSVDT